MSPRYRSVIVAGWGRCSVVNHAGTLIGLEVLTWSAIGRRL